MCPHPHYRSQKTGLAPGSLVHVGRQFSEETAITLIRYDETGIIEKPIASIADLKTEKDLPGVSWVNIDGLKNIAMLGELGEIFCLHPLILEDILNTEQRPKIEDMTDYLYVVLRNFHNHTGDTVLSEQVSLVLGKHFVLSFQEKPSTLFDSVRERLRTAKGRLRKAGSDYLLHALIDNVVDNYFILLEDIEDRIEQIEDGLVRRPTPQKLQALHRLKRELILLRKAIWPLRETVSSLQRADSPLIEGSNALYFKDIFDHIIAIIDTVDTFRDMLSGMLDLYLSTISIRLNEVMKVLTIIATIFMPLSFIVGIYGMNFEFIPELKWHWGYFAVWGVMLGVVGGMMIYFKRKKWI